jgi:hypothetical protein
VVAADVSMDFEGVHTNVAEPQSEDGTGGDALALRSLRGPHWDLAASDSGSCPPGGTAPGDAMSDLGLLGYPGLPSPPASWSRVEGSQSWHVRGLQLRTSYCGKQWLWSDETSCI